MRFPRSIASSSRSLLVVAILCAPRVAMAQEEESKARAEVLFREGVALLQNSRWAEACEKLGQSQALAPATGTALDIGYCSEKLGRYASALVAYRDALDRATAQNKPDRVATAQKKITEIEAKVSRIRLTTSSGTPLSASELAEIDAPDIKIDEAPFGDLTTARPVDPGDHLLTFSKRGKQTALKIVHIEPESRETRIVLPVLDSDGTAAPAALRPSPSPSPAAPSPAIEPTFEPERHRPIGTYVAFGLGAAFLAFGGVSGVMAMNAHEKSNDNCVGGCNEEGVASEDDARLWARVSTGAFIAGAIAVGVGTYLYLSYKPKVGTAQATTMNPLRWSF